MTHNLDYQEPRIPKGYLLHKYSDNEAPLEIRDAIHFRNKLGRWVAYPQDPHPAYRELVPLMVRAGFMDPDGNWFRTKVGSDNVRITNKAKYVWVKMYTNFMHLECPDWVFFEKEWRLRNLQQQNLKEEDFDYWENQFRLVFAE